MKTFNIDRESFSDFMEELWEECAKNDCTFKAFPKSKMIEVYRDSVVIGRAYILEVTDVCDSMRQWFKEAR